jgi:hypothetical protein
MRSVLNSSMATFLLFFESSTESLSVASTENEIVDLSGDGLLFVAEVDAAAAVVVELEGRAVSSAEPLRRPSVIFPRGEVAK